MRAEDAPPPDPVRAREPAELTRLRANADRLGCRCARSDIDTLSNWVEPSNSSRPVKLSTCQIARSVKPTMPDLRSSPTSGNRPGAYNIVRLFVTQVHYREEEQKMRRFECLVSGADANGDERSGRPSSCARARRIDPPARERGTVWLLGARSENRHFSNWVEPSNSR